MASPFPPSPNIPPGVADRLATTATPRMSPVARYLIAIVLLMFSGSWGYAITKQKDVPTVVDAVIILLPLVFAFAAAVPASFTFVVTTVKPLVPQWGRRSDDHG